MFAATPRRGRALVASPVASHPALSNGSRTASAATAPPRSRLRREIGSIPGRGRSSVMVVIVGGQVRHCANRLRKIRESGAWAGRGGRHCACAVCPGPARSCRTGCRGRSRDRRADAGLPRGGRLLRLARNRRRGSGQRSAEVAGLRAARRNAAGRVRLPALPRHPRRLRHPRAFPQCARRRCREAPWPGARRRRLHREVGEPGGGRRPRQGGTAPLRALPIGRDASASDASSSISRRTRCSSPAGPCG